ncbi:hypothetical protein ACFL0W_05325 [Nanoarchaeota archaeon]
MKLSNKLIEDVVVKVAGQDVLPLVTYLKNKKNISEFKIAEMIEQEINVTRNMLYRLYHSNLVSFNRKKDKQKGWYIYYWTFKPKSIKFLCNSINKERLEKLQERLEREQNNHFYVCPSCSMRLNFEQAMDFQFKCPEDGKIVEQEDNAQKIIDIEAEIKELEKDKKK